METLDILRVLSFQRCSLGNLAVCFLLHSKDANVVESGPLEFQHVTGTLATWCCGQSFNRCPWLQLVTDCEQIPATPKKPTKQKETRNRLANFREASRDWARWDESDGMVKVLWSVLWPPWPRMGAPGKGFLHGIHCRLWKVQLPWFRLDILRGSLGKKKKTDRKQHCGNCTILNLSHVYHFSPGAPHFPIRFHVT